MIQRILGISVGGLITFLALLILVGGTLVPDRNTAYIVSIVIGGIANFLWPIVIGMWMARRVKARRDAQVSNEVERQMAQQQKPPGS